MLVVHYIILKDLPKVISKLYAATKIFTLLKSAIFSTFYTYKANKICWKKPKRGKSTVQKFTDKTLNKTLDQKRKACKVQQLWHKAAAGTWTKEQIANMQATA